MEHKKDTNLLMEQIGFRIINMGKYKLANDYHF